MNDKSMHLKTSILAIIAIIAVIIIIGSIVNAAFKPKANYTTTTEQRIAPIGKIYIEGDIDINAVASAKVEQKTPSRDSQTIYNTFCAACHLSGVAGAPKYGDKNDWSQRVSKGLESLTKSVIDGKGAMPPKGTCGDCSDQEIKSVVEYMLESVK